MAIQDRRRIGAAGAAALVFALLTGCSAGGAGDAGARSPQQDAPADSSAELDKDFKALEGEYDARLGVYALGTGSDRSVSFRSDERFAFASTHKAFSAGALLQRYSVEEMEDKQLSFSEEDLQEHAPIAEKHVDEGSMTLMEAADAAVRYSDNTAANLLFDELGGPEGLDAALEEVGDDVTSVDRTEPGLNEWKPGEERDTSTPEAMATTLRAYALDDTLPKDRRTALVDMLKGNTTGDDLIRAGVPEGWEVGDKTGNATYGTRNDIAVLWPPKGDPIVLAVMSSRDTEDADHDDALIADAAAIVAKELG